MNAVQHKSEEPQVGIKVATALMNFLAVVAIAICGWIAGNQKIMSDSINSMRTSVAVIQERLPPDDLNDRVISVEIHQVDILKRLENIEDSRRPRRIKNRFGE